jgi:2-dehydropantoate 2-reductase
MRIVVVGLGGVGGVAGGRLAAGLADSPEHEIVFWCRGETLSAIKEKGLEVFGHDRHITVRPSLATYSVDEVKSADLLIFATKNYHLEAAARELAPAANSNTAVLPLLNGVSAVAVLEKQLPQSDVLGGCIYISAHVERPGVVKQAGTVQRVIFGKKGISEAENLTLYGGICQTLKKSGLGITLTERIDVEMWSKLVFLSPFAGVTTLFKRSISEVFSHEESFLTAKRMIDEIEALARVKNIDLPKNIADITIEKARSFAPLTKTSMQVDHENGRQTELDSLIGYICREGKTNGVSMPTYEKVYEGLKEICKE